MLPSKDGIFPRGVVLLPKLSALILAILSVKVAKNGTAGECAVTDGSSAWPADRFNFITFDLALPTSDTIKILGDFSNVM
jgi:hypothetical protein